MKTSPSQGKPQPVAKPAAGETKTAAARSAHGLLRGWMDFWFTAISPTGLHGLRVLTGLLLIAWALPFADQIDATFSLRGWMDAEAYREASRQVSRLGEETLPVPIGWSLFYLAGDDPGMVRVLYWSGIGVFALFTLGFASRITGILSWVMVQSLMANPATRFEAEYLVSILAFYLMIGYVYYGQWNSQPSLAARLIGPRDAWLFWRGGQDSPRLSYAANLTIRFIQVHFALIVVTSAFHKLQFGAWWSGVAFWYPMHAPLATTENDIHALAAGRDSYLFFLSLAQYLVLAWQLTFPFFAWRTGKWRYLLLGGGVLGWIGSVYIYRMPLFGPAFLIGFLSYLTPAEWEWLRDRIIPRTSATEGDRQSRKSNLEIRNKREKSD